MRALIERGADWLSATRYRLRMPGGSGRRSWLRWTLIGIALLLLLWYPVGMAVYTHIDDDPGFEPRPTAYDAGGSKAVATAAALVEREIERWAPNKPFWHPAAALDNMPNYQLGLMYAVSRFAIEMGDQLGRTRGSSAIDADLDRAAGLLKYDGRIWYWGSGGLLPVAPAQRQYLTAAKALARYNERLANGEATYDRRADNLIALLNRVGADLGASSAALDKRALETNAGWFDTIADDLLFNVKGRLYAYYLLLRDIGVDFDQAIAEKQASKIWQQMLASLRQGAELYPPIVSNGYEDGLFMPSHLTALGFYLLRARTQLKEVADALSK